MPCASVSEKPTRVSAEYLNGGFAPVARPSSSLISRGILRVAPAALSVVSDTPRRSEATSRQMCCAYGAGMSAPLPSRRGPRAPSYRPRLPVSRRLEGQQWRADRARPDRLRLVLPRPRPHRHEVSVGGLGVGSDAEPLPPRRADATGCSLRRNAAAEREQRPPDEPPVRARGASREEPVLLPRARVGSA